MRWITCALGFTLFLVAGCKSEQPDIVYTETTVSDPLEQTDTEITPVALPNETLPDEAAERAAALASEVLQRQQPAATPMRGDWQQFRRTFPYHTQVIALSDPAADGTRTLIVSEPPPHVTASDVLVSLAPVLRRHRLEKQILGFDGSVTDLVAAVSGSEKEIAAAISVLYRKLFSTSYKAYVLRLPVRPTTTRFDLDLDVTATEIRKWLTQDGELFSPVEGGPSVAASELFKLATPAVYRSIRRGLIAWWIPSSATLANCRIQSRQFAIDSDLVIGAIAKPAGTLILARERVVPIDVLPPLRFETIALLASVQSAGNYELQQSYERNAHFAGRFDTERDWAPILLSPELRDTEYGSLLNITDQLLKSWTNKGMTQYANFNYPKPPSYPFARPLPRQLAVSKLTYNWNTRGAAYAVEAGDTKLVALNRSGALPVSYIPESDDEEAPPATVDAEETAYGYFSKLSDANLVRVVQYAALYQIFTATNVRNAPVDATAGGYASRRLDELTEELSDALANADDEKRQELTKRAAPILAKVLRLEIEDAQEVTLLLLNKYSERPGNPSHPAVRIILSIIAGTTDLPKRYADDVAKHATGWIHTPSVVVSWNDDPETIVVGGHNLGSKPTEVLVSDRATRGLPIVDAEGRILVHSADAARVRGLIRPASRLKDKSPAARQIELARMLREIPDTPPRTIPAALRIAETRSGSRKGVLMPDPPALGSPRRVGWNASGEMPVARKVDETTGAQLTVERRGDTYLVMAEGTPPIEAYTKSDVTDAVVTYMRNRNGSEPLLIDLQNFREQEAAGLVRECQLHFRDSGNPRAVSGVVRSKGVTDAKIDQFRAERFDFSRATVTTAVRQTTEGFEGRISVEIPSMTNGSRATGEIRVGFRKTASQSVISRIMSMIGKAITSILSDMKGAYDSFVFNRRLSHAVKRIQIETGVDFEVIDHQFGDSSIDIHFVSLDGVVDEIVGTESRRAA